MSKNSSSRNLAGPLRLPGRLHFAVLLTLTAAIVFAGYRFYQSQKRVIELNIRRQLAEMADLKVNQVVAWRLERVGDATVAIAETRLMPAVQQVLASSESAETRQRVLAWMDAIRSNYQYANIVLADRDGKIRLSSGQLLGTPQLYADMAQGAARADGVTFRDFPLDIRVVRPHFSLGVGLKSDSGDNSGAMLLGIDPSVALYPTILKWPTASQTGEAVLVRRDGDQVLYLSDLRRKPGSAMELRKSLTDRTSPVVRAVLGEEGITDGIDYSGIPVLASARRVPDSEWFVVAKIDESEAYAPLRESRTLILLIGGLLVVMCAAGVGLIWRHQVSTSYRQQYEAEQERRALLGHYDYLTRYANDAILLLDESGAIVEANERATDSFGYSKQDLLQMNVRDLKSPETLAEFQEAWDTLNRQGHLVFETTNRRKDGTSFATEISARLMEVEGKKYCQSIIRDITERKQAEAELRKERDFTSTLVQACPAYFVAVGPAFHVLMMNDAMLYALGYKREDVIGKDYVKLFLPETERAAVASVFNALLTGTGTTSNVNRILTSTGKELLVEWSNRSIFKPDGKPDYFFGIGTDVTERKQSEEELRVSRERLELVLDASDEGYWDWNLMSGEVHHSPRYDTMLGYQPGELETGYGAWREMIHSEDLPLLDERFKTFFESGENTFSREFRVRCKAGNYAWILSRGKIVERDKNGAPLRMVGTNTDITERKKLEEQFLQAQKLESVGRLAGGVAHDFNNLLTVINGYSALLLKRLPEHDVHRKQVQEIREAGEQAAGLTQQLLAFSRKQVIQPQRLKLNAAVADSQKMLRRMVGEDIELATLLRATADEVMADPGQIQQILMNLVVNARDAMPNGGSLIIETRNPSDVVEGSDLTPDRCVLLQVTDTGVGMDPETCQQIFEPFFTTKGIGKGTGLGLSTVYGIVRQSGGIVRVESEPGKGAAFKVYLPLTQTGDAGQIPKPRSGNLHGSETVLIVEDQDGVRGLATETLQSYGYSVVSAANAGEALIVVERLAEPIHLLLTDVVMPGLNGKMLAERVKAMKPETKILYMSGYTDEAIGQAGVLDSGSALVQKPFAPETLAARVREVLDTHPV